MGATRILKNFLAVLLTATLALICIMPRTNLAFAEGELPVPATGVSLNVTSLNLTVGGATETIIATVQPNNATNQTINWSSSNTGVATVVGGSITAMSAGTSTITATTVDGGFFAICDVTVTAANVPVTGVSLSSTTLTVAAGGTSTLTPTVAPTNATNKNVTWTSSNASVASVSTSGEVTGVAAGTATITVTTVDGPKIATCVVTVTAANIPVTGVSLSATTLTVASGSTSTLTPTIAPTNATNKNVTWTSSNTSVASVSAYGVVTGVATGTATITVTTVDGAKIATCVVTVTAANIISSQSPASGATGVSPDAKITFKFTKDMLNSTVNEDNIYLRKSGSSSNISNTFTYDTSSRTVTLTPKSALEGSTKYTIYVSSYVRDYNSVAVSSTSWDFTTGTASFSVSEKTPAANATGIAATVFVEAKFSREVDSKSLTNSTFTLTKTSGGTVVPATIAYRASTKTATLTPTVPLTGGAQYTVNLTRDVKDIDGTRLADTVWYFTVKSTGITVSSQTPGSGAYGIPVSAIVSFRFSDDVIASNVNIANVYILDPKTNMAVFAITNYDSVSRTVTIRPYAALAGSTTYKVVVNSSINGAYGDKVVATEWSFTTETVSRVGTENNPVVKLNGKYVDFSDAAPYVKNGRTFLPMRTLFELLGAQMTWDNAKQKVTATLNGNKVELFIGKKTAYRNGKAVTLDAPPELRNGRTMLPLRFAAESLGVAVAWDKDTYTVLLGNN